mgnify:CR=1 FL=1
MKNNNCLWQRIIICLLFMLALWVIMEYFKSLTTPIFFWMSMLYVFFNFWKYQEHKKSQFFWTPIIIACVLMVPTIISFVGWIIAIPAFNNFWRQIFGWPSFLVAMLLAMHAILILEAEIRASLKRHTIKLIKKIKPYLYNLGRAIIVILIIILLTCLCSVDWPML